MTVEKLAHYVHRFPGMHIAVVGDLMLDRYVWGRASRISQEAPVPIVRVERETIAPGGAANVVRNILALGGRATAFGRVGSDAYASQLCNSLQKAGAAIDGIMTGERPTTVKTRVLAGNQQVVRIDHEDGESDEHELLAGLLDTFKETMKSGRVDAIIVEDYAKGLLTCDVVSEIVSIGTGYGIPVALDPHPSHNFAVQGLTLVTPNRTEAFALTGTYYHPGTTPLKQDSYLLCVAEKLLFEWNMQNLLVTLGADGMALFRKGMEPVQIPTRAQEVFDVSGAGDTVMATAALSLAAGAEAGEAAELANHAAGIVVGKIGTAAVTATELEKNLARERL